MHECKHTTSTCATNPPTPPISDHQAPHHRTQPPPFTPALLSSPFYPYSSHPPLSHPRFTPSTRPRPRSTPHSPTPAAPHLPPFPGHCRLGWATTKAELQAPVGVDAFGFSYRDLEGSKVHKGLREDYGEPYAEGDVVGLLLHMPPGGKRMEPGEPELVRYKGGTYAKLVRMPGAGDWEGWGRGVAWLRAGAALAMGCGGQWLAGRGAVGSGC